ncbi:hypothetical protein B0H16DRAFT_1318652, partial [Mycena metata]
MLVWLDGHLPPQALRDKLGESDLFKSKMTDWLENTIRSEMMNTERNTTDPSVRRPPRENPNPGTIPAPLLSQYWNPVTFHRDYVEYVDALLVQFNWHVHLSTCWKYLKRGEPKTDEHCRMGMNGETQSSTVVDSDTYAIHLRRLHPWIANYNDLVMFLLKCNMDIKFIGSGEAAKAFLYYVTDYITKAVLPVHAGLAALSHAIHAANVKHPELGDDSQSTAASYTSAMTSTVNSMLGHQEISHQQVMSYLIGGGDHYTSDNFAILYWRAFRRCVDRYFEPDSDD